MATRERSRSRERADAASGSDRSRWGSRGDHYGPASSSSGGGSSKAQRREEMKHEDSSKREWGQGAAAEAMALAPKVREEDKEKANFGLTGALAKDKKTGNVFNGVVMKWSEPPDAAQPTRQWRLYVFKAEELLQTLHIHRQSAFLVGRDDRVADVLLDHPSASKQHAVIQFRLVPVVDATGKPARVVKPYIMDLGSSNKTFLNNAEIDDSRYYEMKEGDMIKFGASTREYVLLHDGSAAAGSGSASTKPVAK